MRNTDDFIIFYHLIQHGSFSKAAEVVGLTKSMVSKRITRLEQEMGVQLLYRTTRKLSLTEAGETFFSHAQEIFQAVESANESMAGLGDRLSGEIRITVPTISGELFLPEAIASFCAKYPDIRIHMDLDNQFVDLVDKGYDLAIRTGVLPDSSYIARKLIDIQWVICGSPEYFNKHPAPQVYPDLKHHNCLLYSYQENGANEWQFHEPNGTRSLRVHGNFSTNNASALRKSALLGQGLIYVPNVLVDKDLRDGHLVQVLSDQVAKQLGIYAIYPYTRHQPVKVKIFIEHLYQCYQKQISG